jgi:hypothetical protein
MSTSTEVLLIESLALVTIGFLLLVMVMNRYDVRWPWQQGPRVRGRP